MRVRGIYLAAVFVTIVLGIGSRKYTSVLPDFVVEHLGDALWAAMIYFGVRALFLRMTIPYAFLLSLGFCYGVELSQLYHAEWIDRIRGTVLGGLVLGRGFLYIDLVRYSVGAAVAGYLDYMWCKPASKSVE